MRIGHVTFWIYNMANEYLVFVRWRKHLVFCGRLWLYTWKQNISNFLCLNCFLNYINCLRSKQASLWSDVGWNWVIVAKRFTPIASASYHLICSFYCTESHAKVASAWGDQRPSFNPLSPNQFISVYKFSVKGRANERNMLAQHHPTLLG